MRDCRPSLFFYHLGTDPSLADTNMCAKTRASRATTAFLGDQWMYGNKWLELGLIERRPEYSSLFLDLPLPMTFI